MALGWLAARRRKVARGIPDPRACMPAMPERPTAGTTTGGATGSSFARECAKSAAQRWTPERFVARLAVSRAILADKPRLGF